MSDSPAAALQAIGKAAGHNETRLRAIITHGVLQGWRIAFIISAAALLLGAIFVARRYPGRAAERELGRAQRSKSATPANCQSCQALTGIDNFHGAVDPG
jgi:hypothetical protein